MKMQEKFDDSTSVLRERGTAKRASHDEWYSEVLTKKKYVFEALKCSQCKAPLGVAVHSDNLVSAGFNPVYCFLCAHNFTDVVEACELTHLPDTQDLYDAFDGRTIALERCLQWRSNVRKWLENCK